MTTAARPHRARGLLSRRSLYLIILPTEQCQLRCTYCYQAYELGRMSPEIVRGLERWIARRADDLRYLVLEWFGGEPLLAPDIVERVQSYATELERDRPRFSVRGMMTTNAMLLEPERLRRLTEAGVRTFQIALDGPAELHDRLRVTAGGGGTFDRIWANLIGAHRTSLEFVVHLRLHLSDRNSAALRAFLLECRDVFGGDDRFQIALRPLHQPGLQTDRTAPVPDKEPCQRTLHELSEFAESIGLILHRQPFEGARPKAGCYAAAAGSFVVRPNGELAKCTLAMGHPRNRVGTLLEDGRIELDRQLMRGWQRGIYSENKSELQCPAMGWVFDEGDSVADPQSQRNRLASL